MPPRGDDELSPWDDEHARRILARVGRAQARARHAAIRYEIASEHAATHTGHEREMHQREAAQHLDAQHRHEQAVVLQLQHLRHVFATDAAFEHWLDTHDADLDGAEDAVADAEDHADEPVSEPSTRHRSP